MTYENEFILIFIYLTYCLLLQRLYVQLNFMKGYYFILYMSWDNMVGIVTRLMGWPTEVLWFNSQQSMKFLLLLQSIQTGPEDDPAFCSRILDAFPWR